MESFLQASQQPISATATQSPQSDSAMDQSEPPDKCQLQQDAYKEAMVRCKAAMKLLNETQEAWFRCRHGISLSQAPAGISSEVYNLGFGLLSGQTQMAAGLDQIAFSMGLKIE